MTTNLQMKADIVFAVDQSTSLTAQVLSDVKAFLTSLVELFTVATNATQIALVSFSSDIGPTSIDLKQGNESSTLLEAIEALTVEGLEPEADFGRQIDQSRKSCRAMTEILNSTLKPENGWRHGATYVFFITASK